MGLVGFVGGREVLRVGFDGERIAACKVVFMGKGVSLSAFGSLM